MIRKLQYICKGAERIAQNVTTSSYASTAICITAASLHLANASQALKIIQLSVIGVAQAVITEEL
jgi:hypothetical protein